MKRLIKPLKGIRLPVMIPAVVAVVALVAGITLAVIFQPWNQHRLPSMADNKVPTRISLMSPDTGEFSELTTYGPDTVTPVSEVINYRNGDIATIHFRADGRTIEDEKLVREDGSLKEERSPLAHGQYQVVDYAADGKSVLSYTLYDQLDTIIKQTKYDEKGNLTYSSQTRVDGTTVIDEFYSDGHRKLFAVNDGTNSHEELYLEDGSLSARFSEQQYTVTGLYYRADGSLAEKRVFSYDGSMKVTVCNEHGQPLYEQQWYGKDGSGYDPPYTINSASTLDSDGNPLVVVQLTVDGKSVQSVTEPVSGHPGWTKTTEYNDDGTLSAVYDTDSGGTIVDSRQFAKGTHGPQLFDKSTLEPTPYEAPVISVPTSGPGTRWGD